MTACYSFFFFFLNNYFCEIAKTKRDCIRKLEVLLPLVSVDLFQKILMGGEVEVLFTSLFLNL